MSGTELSRRAQKILQAVVSEYLQSGDAVGSRTVTRRHDLGLSPATVRNVMSDLEELGLLEQRLDMIVYRAKFAPTIWAARQIVSHGHIRVNGVKCNIASRRCYVGDEITLGTKAQEMALVLEAQSLAEREIPDYVSPDGTTKVTFVRVPALDEVPYPVKMEPNLVVEFYSR